MRNTVLLVLAVSIVTRADGRVYYLDNSEGARSNDAIYPIVDQSSRDLDLALSAGDPVENENGVPPIRKVYTVVAPEKPYIELSGEADRPISYYRLTGLPATRRNNYDDVVLVPERSRKLKTNGNNNNNNNNNNNKGEVILELRVIANHDSA